MVTATLPDSLLPPKRIVWEGEKVVVLDRRQEEKVHEKMQWKEQYKNDAVTAYLVSLKLQGTIADLEDQNRTCKASLVKAENNALSKNESWAKSQEDLRKEQASTKLLKEEKSDLEKKLMKTRFIAGGLTIGLGGALYLLFTN